MYNSIIFDFGNVLIRFDEETIMRPYFRDKNEIKRCLPIIFDRAYWDKLDDGTLTENGVCKLIKGKVPEESLLKCEKTLLNWYKNIPPIFEMWELVDKLKKMGKRIFLLSNISKYFADNYSSVPELSTFLSNFDGLVFSSEVGVVKPDSKIFDILIKKFDIKKDECIFIDDSIKNVIGAKNYGIDAFHYKNNIDDLKEILL